MTDPAVTVFLPCYNAHRHLAAAIDSVRAQTSDNIEILVVNDGSTDPDTLEFLRRLPTDIRVIHQENRGLAGARNTGFREAVAPLVLPLDCDDMIAPRMIEACLDALARSPDASYAYTTMALIGNESGTISKTFNFFEQLGTNQLPYCLLMRRAAWADVGGYDETMRGGYEDWEMNIRLGAQGHFGVQVSQPLFHYRVSSDGMLQSISRVRHAQLWRDIQRKNPEAYRLAALWRTWRKWRRRPSTHPLWIVFVLFALHRVLPAAVFNRLFRMLHIVGRTEREDTTQSLSGATMSVRGSESGGPER